MSQHVQLSQVELRLVDADVRIESMPIDHILVPRAAIPNDKILSFDLYVKVADKTIKVANKNEAIDPERISRYLQYEKDVLYIDREELEHFMDEKFQMMFDMLGNQNDSLEKRFERFIRCLELSFVDLKIVRPLARKFQRVEMLVDWCYEFYRKRELRQMLLHEAFWQVKQPITKRALLGASLCLNLFMEQSDCAPAAFRSIFTGALLRDVSLLYTHTTIDPHIPELYELSEQDRDDFFAHPSGAIALLSNFITVDDIMTAVIEQHHELPRGDGFPRGLKRAEIYLPAQYLNLADFTITELEKYTMAGGKLEFESVSRHLSDVMPEENRKNLPLLLRVLTPVFRS